MKLKEWFKKYSVDIFIGVVVSILTAMVMKGAEWIKEVAPTAGNSVWRFFVNTFFHAAAKTTDTALMTLMFAAFFGIAIAYVFNLMRKALSITKKAIVTEENIAKDVNNSCAEAAKTENEIIAAGTKTDAQKNIIDAKKGRTITVVGIVYFVLYFCYILLFNYLPQGVWNDYQRDLLKIAPYIDQQELDEIKSDWVCMQSKEDYDRIYGRINEIKTEYDLP